MKRRRNKPNETTKLKSKNVTNDNNNFKKTLRETCERA